MSEQVTLAKQGEIGVITIDNPPVNALSPGVPEGIRDCIRAFAEDETLKAAILIGAGRTFIAGADIKEFGNMTERVKKGERLSFNPILATIEGCPKPVICAIHGTALGGGLEVAMACHGRVALASAKVGQPEVKLGIIPGAGGTQRLPRLAGVPKALEMCARGDNVSAPEAHRVGIVDRIVEGDLLAEAIAFARELIEKGDPPRRTRDLADQLGDEATNAQIFAMARQMAGQKARGMIAPFRAIDAVEAATQLPFDEGLAREAELFSECLISPQCEALVHVFLSQKQVAKIPNIPADLPLIEIEKAAIVGAGTMGGGIAMTYANAGIPVLLKESKQEYLDRGLETIRKNYARSVQKGRLTRERMDERMARISPTLDYNGFEEADIVIEAVFEAMDVKKQVFAELDRICKPEAILASNTSTLDIDEIASATSRPEQVIGNHFFSPANVMKLLEIVRGKATSNEVIASSMALGKRLRKVAVLVGNCYGFVGNRMVDPYMREGQFLVEEGARVDQVDAALEEFGMVMGVFRMGDLAGVDVSWRIKEAHKHLIPEGRRVSNLFDRLYEQGRYGQKTGKGWYRYEEGDRKAIPDPEVEKLIEACAKEAGIERREIDAQEIVDRTIYALINEGARILEEGIALRAGDIDVIYVYGYGFPPFRGGPMMHADQVGLPKILDRIREFENRFGEIWSPAPLLIRLAEEGKSFEQYDREKRA